MMPQASLEGRTGQELADTHALLIAQTPGTQLPSKSSVLMVRPTPSPPAG